MSDDAKAKPAPGRMFVVGRVLDPEGKPVPGAKAMVAARAKVSPSTEHYEPNTISAIVDAEADDSGRFRVDAPRSSSSRYDDFMAIALAPGFGTGWSKLDADAKEPAAEISLPPEQVIEGRLLDVQGRPAHGVVLSIPWMLRDLVPDAGPQVAGRISHEGPRFSPYHHNELPGWPAAAKTDAEGHFTIHGVGRRVHTALNVLDPRFARQTIRVETDGAPGPKEVSVTLEPAKTFFGRVTYADTGKPVPHARLEVYEHGEGHGFRPNEFQTDADGRFRVNPSAGDHYEIRAWPPAGQLYLAASKTVDWPKGAIEQSMDLALPRGVVIRGQVVEEGTGHAVAGAR